MALLQIVITLFVLAAFAPLVGHYMARVYEGQPHILNSLLSPFERWIYRVTGINNKTEMRWSGYAVAVLVFNALGFLAVFILQLLQNKLPLNPQHLPAVSVDLAFNTAVSFMTNTNWQAYSGETTLSDFTQMLGLTVQNFLSAATGMAVLVALIRGLSRVGTDKIGNFWVDLTRSIVYILLPLSILFALVFVSQGVIQNLDSYVTATTVEGEVQTLPMGPAASQISIKMLGTNGGGFFNANSSHPFENPTPLTNWLQLLLILLIPAGLVFTFGKMIRSPRQAVIVFEVMMVLLIVGIAVAMVSESLLPSMEGKEVRFGTTSSVLWTVFTSAASNGSVNAMISSLTPLASGVAMLNMMLGEVIFGGVGSGLYGLLLFVLLTVFLAGLLVGRTPEYLGKKIEAEEIKMVMIAVILPSALILCGAAISLMLPLGISSLSARGPHGLSEMVYAFTSAAANNGSAFAGLNANTPYLNYVLAVVMLGGRFAVLVPVLRIAGILAGKKVSAPSFGTFATDGQLFGGLLIGVIIIVGGLTFFPVLTLGPLIEHFLMLAHKTF